MSANEQVREWESECECECEMRERRYRPDPSRTVGTRSVRCDFLLARLVDKCICG